MSSTDTCQPVTVPGKCGSGHQTALHELTVAQRQKTMQQHDTTVWPTCQTDSEAAADNPEEVTSCMLPSHSCWPLPPPPPPPPPPMRRVPSNDLLYVSSCGQC